MRGQPSENVLQIGMRIMPVELGRLDQAHQRSRAFATTLRPCEEPVFFFQEPSDEFGIGSWPFHRDGLLAKWQLNDH